MITGLGAPSVGAATRAARGPAALVLEDDADQRELIAIHLRAGGCSVVTTGRPAEALELVARDRFVLAVVDVHLPGTSDDVVTLLRTRQPGCRVVLSTRHDRSAFPAAADVLVKPFTADQVRRLVPRRAGSVLPLQRAGSDR